MYPPLNPIFFHLGPLSIRWYGLIMVLAIFFGAYVASRYIARHGEDSSTIWDMLLWIVIPAVIGARLYFVFIQSPRGPNGLDGYLAHPIEILQIWNGGIHIYGALIFGAIALLLYLRFHKLPYLIYLDGIGLGILLGQAIGRLGNFINQELYGPPTTLPWGLRIDPDHRIAPYNNLNQYPDSTRFHPLFLYELTWDALGFALLFWISRRFEKRLRKGDLFLLYLIWAPLGRFFIEFLRTDSWFFPGTHFNVLHIIIALIVISAATILFLRHRHQPTLAIASTISSTPLTTEATDTETSIPTSTIEAEVTQPETATPIHSAEEETQPTSTSDKPETDTETSTPTNVEVATSLTTTPTETEDEQPDSTLSTHAIGLEG